MKNISKSLTRSETVTTIAEEKGPNTGGSNEIQIKKEKE